MVSPYQALKVHGNVATAFQINVVYGVDTTITSACSDKRHHGQGRKYLFRIDLQYTLITK